MITLRNDQIKELVDRAHENIEDPGTKFYMQRLLGNFPNLGKPRTMFPVLSSIPEDVDASDEEILEDKTFLSNVLLTLCAESINHSKPSSVSRLVSAEELITRGLKYTYNSDSAKNLFTDILNCYSGDRLLFRHMGRAFLIGKRFLKSDERIDTFSFYTDLQSWDSDSTKEKWAKCFLNFK